MIETASWVSKRPNICGGDACIRDTRITVWGIAAYRRLDATDEQILEAIVGLTLADLEAADEYATANAAEIDKAIRQNEMDDDGCVE